VIGNAGRRFLVGSVQITDGMLKNAATTKNAAIDHALLAATRVATAREAGHLYGDYRIAVFQPGLSPEQRRLLFDSVIERLDLPLPRGELQPITRAATW